MGTVVLRNFWGSRGKGSRLLGTRRLSFPHGGWMSLRVFNLQAQVDGSAGAWTTLSLRWGAEGFAA